MKLLVGALVGSALVVLASGCGSGHRVEPGRSLSLVAIGDSIPFNSPDDCSGCTGFVDQYADAISKATGAKVKVTNLSEHNSLTLPRLLDELDTMKPQLSKADVIVVGIAHNTLELNADEPCGAPLGADDAPDWSHLTPACAAASEQAARPQYDQLFTTIKGWRQGKPTLLRALNRYDDLQGWPGHPITAAHAAVERGFVTGWDTMLCASAEAAGFTCTDLHAAFNGVDGTTPSGDLLGDDYTHPTQKGNDLITKTLVKQGFAPLA